VSAAIKLGKRKKTAQKASRCQYGVELKQIVDHLSRGTDMLNKDSFSRNTTQGFARNVRKNLNFIIKERDEDEDVHEVTQLVTSLLGLVVFPWEADALKHIESFQLKTLEREGWPRWRIQSDEKGDTHTLKELTRHLRNAVCHRRISFSSDDRDMGQHIVNVSL
jgi:hypothetical protein